MSKVTEVESLAKQAWDSALGQVDLALDSLSDSLLEAVLQVSFAEFFRRIPVPPFFVFDPVGPALRAGATALNAVGDFFGTLSQIPLGVLAELAAVNMPDPGDDTVMTIGAAYRFQLFVLTDVSLRLSSQGPFGTVGVISYLAIRIRKILSTIKFFQNPTFANFFRKVAGIGTPVWVRLYQLISLAWRFSIAGFYAVMIIELARLASLPAQRKRIIDDFCLSQDSSRKRVSGARRVRANLRSGPDQG